MEKGSHLLLQAIARNLKEVLHYDEGLSKMERAKIEEIIEEINGLL
jgi:hypothetical protein